MTMSGTSQNRAPAGAPHGPWVILSSMRFALALVAVLVAACIAGTVVPQGDAVVSYARQHPDAVRRLTVLRALGLTDVFHAPWFAALLGVLALSLITCGFKQARTLAHTARNGRTVSSLLIHLSLVAILAGGLIRGIWGQKGSLQLHVGESVSDFQSAATSVPLPFEVRLLGFDVEIDERAARTADASERLIVHWADGGPDASLPVSLGTEQSVSPQGPRAAAGSFTVRVLRSVPDFMMDPVSHIVETRSAQPRNPAIQVSVVGAGYATTNWLFAKYPDVAMPMRRESDAPFRMVYERSAPPVKNYRSTLEIAEKGQVVKQASLAVNAPLSYRGYTFYQSGYNPDDATWTSLLVVHDPGVPLVFAGFTALIVGLFLGLYVWPRESAPKPEAMPR